MDMLADAVAVVIGVDTHKHTHTAAVVDAVTGGVLAGLTAAADPSGYGELAALADAQPDPRAWAIEGTGGYGAGLARFLRERGERVVEVDRPRRAARRNGAKSDELDAARAAREALGRRHPGEPRAHGQRQALSVLLAVRRGAVEASTVAQRQLHGLAVAAPEPVRARLRGLRTPAMVRAAAALRVDPRWDDESRVIAGALRSVARRVRELDAEAAAHEWAIEALVRAWRPDLLELLGVGPINAAVVLCAWSHPGRVRSDAAFAMLGGAAPIPASSGQTVRHRLNRSGDRQFNRALHTIVIHRLRLDPPTKAYAEARRAEGKTDREIKRCLKRYVARQLFRQLERGLVAP